MKRWRTSSLTLMIMAMLCFSLMAALAKFACGTLAASEVVFFRSAFGTLLILGIHYRSSAPRGSLWGRNRKALVGRGLLGAAALNLYFYGLAGLPVMDAMLLNQVSPLFVLPLGFWLLHEPVKKRQLFLLPLAFVGVLMVLQPQFDMINVAGLSALASALFSAFAYLMVRKLAHTDPAHTVVFYFTLFSMVASMPLMLFDFRWPDPLLWLVLVGVGMLAIGGQMFMTLALQIDAAGHVSMFGYFGVVFALLWDILFWGQLPGYITVLGAILILGSLFEINRLGSHRVPPRSA